MRRWDRHWHWVVLATAAAVGLEAAAQAPAPVIEESSRGALLYATHCGGCHTAQVHWRDRKLVTDPASLEAQVRRWQAIGGLGWSDEEVADVARYLNAVHYRFPAVAGRQLTNAMGSE